MHSYSVDFEEGDIRTPIFSSIVPDWNHRRASRYFDQDDAECDNDDDSIRSSRPCTPPGLTMSHWSTSVPSAPGPKPAPSARVATTPPSPSPQPQSRWGSVPSYSTASSATVMMAGAPSASAGRDARAATRWTIPPDVYRKAESALARITAMSGGSSASASDRGCAPTHRYSSERDAGPTTGGYDGRDNCHMSSAPLQKHREPPRSPLSPEELERAIGIIEELSIVDKVPPHVFIQCGVSPGTLYHAFNHLGLKLPDDLW
ncbi:hypothetical protein AX14_002109 [Amanita brunnescens Koide BX004]|nr:hypothetical protein AX14_002109 [Amanita brunnescens Koide BX004]